MHNIRLTFSSVFLVIIYLQGVLSACDPNAIAGITKFWNNKPPTNIIPRYDGTWTFIKISSKSTEVDTGLKCFMAVVHSKENALKYYMYFNDASENFAVDTKMTEKAGIVVKDYEIDNIKIQDSQYVVYFDQGVMAFWVCSNQQDGMSAIVVKDYAKTANDPKTKDAIQKAEDSLKKAGLPDVQGIHTECPVPPTTG